MEGMDYWQKQTSDKPLFEDILWSRPETKHGAGKLLIVGGNLHGFSSVGEAYDVATKSGAGSVRAILPDSLHKVLGGMAGAEFAASTPSGSFGREALATVLASSQWADTVMISGELGRNSETSVLLESLVNKYSGPLVVSGDTIDNFYALPDLIADRPNTCVVLNLSQLQKLATALKFDRPFLLGMGMMLLVQTLHEFTAKHQLVIVAKELDNIVVSHQGRVSSTKLREDMEFWRTWAGAKASVFWMQNPSKPYESITSSLL